MNDDDPAASSFVVHRRQLDTYRFARDRGLSDTAYLDLVAGADEAVAAVDGHGFRITPLIELDLGSDGTALAKVETGAVGGSHKARHLFGLLLHLLVEEATSPPVASGPADLAIASCGNAALGAAVVARSAGRRLRVFVPTTADPAILSELNRLGADVSRCPRRPGQEGDPCVVALDQAIADGATAFTVQGNRAPNVIDGGRTLGLELADQLDELDFVPANIFIQIGGGALATAVMDGLSRAWPDRRLPRFHPVQARAAHPYVVCWERVVEVMLDTIGEDDPGSDRDRVELLRTSLDDGDLRRVLDDRPDLMVAWPGTPESVASGILDDVTYDWVTVMLHQIRTGGWPILVDEKTFTEAVKLTGSAAEPPPDETGAAGLAGLITLRRSTTGPEEPSVVLLTG